ncbi:MAG TPA: hypothetical protein VK995_06590 [Oceanipulchritudo sp.]|nr:hypothetical protein [Oceanipulchritudo sp.]
MKSILNTCIALLSLTGATVFGDYLELKSGEMLEGVYQGGSQNNVRFQIGAETRVIQVSEILALTFSGEAAPAATAPTAQATAAAPVTESPKPSTLPAVVTINAGTSLLVSLQSTISTNSNRQGEVITAALETDLIQDGAIVATAGTTVYGKITLLQQAGRMAGQNKLEIQLTDLLVKGQRVPIVTSSVSEAGVREGGKTLKTVAVGAGVGALAKSDSSRGAEKGAAVGAVLAAKKGEPIVFPRGTLFEFTLAQPVTVNL